MTNGYFKIEDYHTTSVVDFKIHPSWWSRHYEYTWAFGFAGEGLVVADMGCGYQERPFKNILATRCSKVYAVDAKAETRNLKVKEPNINLVIADFSKPIKEIEPNSLDRIFCLSVLEEGVNIEAALKEFVRLLKPNGLILLTFDVNADPLRPIGIYKGVKLSEFFQAVDNAGLEAPGSIDFSTTQRLEKPEWNLAVFRCVLSHKAHQDDKAVFVLDWVERNQPKDYPEVGGYIIPMLLAHRKVLLAKELADWLLSIQHPNGAFPDQSGYLRSFDTAACMEGLEVASNYFFDKNYGLAAARAKKWIIDNCLGNNGKIYSQADKKELRNYSLRANGLLGIYPDWIGSQPGSWPFGQKPDRTHYLAYALEGLLALGETERTGSILEDIEKALTPDGFISFWVGPHWQPSSPFYPDFNATSQIGLILTKLKIKPNLTRKLYENMTNIIEKDGGIPTRSGTPATSWTTKWFLDFENALKTI